MKQTDFAPQFPVLWASSGTSTTVQYPLLSGTSLATGRASIDSGFPAANFTPPAAGGVYPWGADWNGALKTLSVSAQNYEAGAIPLFSQSFANSIGGYPQNAIVADTGTAGLFWVSTADANTTVPGASGAAWQKFGWNQFVKQGWGFSNFGNNVIYLGWRPDGNLGLGVDSTDVGNVALQGAGKLAQGGWTEQYYTLAAGGSRTVSLTFNAPVPGYVHVIGSANYAVQNSNQTNLTIIVNGQNLSADQVTGSTAMTNHSCVEVAAGAVTVASYCGTSSQNPPNVGHTLSYLFIPS
ncbi:hypothetical protein NKW43_14215 [Gluconobacter albidus]|uniref:hypothetical protein n=1 Tax=Gluconobacter albidus TaxID=318683 RepID=UPI0020A092EE|nr:hypothetical protein [Gluconobacter albidus]MCP1274823.1 hypothetical protein [Gluconobacter albidus]